MYESNRNTREMCGAWPDDDDGARTGMMMDGCVLQSSWLAGWLFGWMARHEF